MTEHIIKSIAHIKSDFPDKFGIPRQAGIVEGLEALVIFEGEYRNDEAIRGIEGFSHLWLIWQFSANVRESFSPTVRPPRLGGNERIGVFASRSPFRPNALGLSCVKLIGVEKHPDYGKVLRVAGADLMDGTPIFDIKPYIAYADCHPDAVSGFATDSGARLSVHIPDELAVRIPPSKLPALEGILANDPRPRYQSDPTRIYRMDFAEMKVEFRVEGETVEVVSINA